MILRAALWSSGAETTSLSNPSSSASLAPILSRVYATLIWSTEALGRRISYFIFNIGALSSSLYLFWYGTISIRSSGLCWCTGTS
jgi:hypothetical protein